MLTDIFFYKFSRVTSIKLMYCRVSPYFNMLPDLIVGNRPTVGYLSCPTCYLETRSLLSDFSSSPFSPKQTYST